MKTILLILVILHFGGDLFSQSNYIDSIKSRYKIVGMTYAVFNSAQILELGALGKRRVDDTAMVRTTDKFHIGSNTKAIAAFIAGKLVDGKKIKWSTRYFDLFPELKATSRKEYWDITLQDLLSHRAKINPYRSVNAKGDAYKFTGTSVEQKVKFAAKILQEPPAKPDSGQV